MLPYARCTLLHSNTYSICIVGAGQTKDVDPRTCPTWLIIYRGCVIRTLSKKDSKHVGIHIYFFKCLCPLTFISREK